LVSHEVNVMMSSYMETVGEELLEDVCDIHLHLGPDVYERYTDEITMARQAQKAGYRALLFKNHHFPTAARAELVARSVLGMEIFGGIVLNSPVGGINKHAVSAAIDFGAREVWMPTLYSAFHIELVGEPNWPYPRVRPPVHKQPVPEGIRILDSEGELVPDIHDILDMIASADIILSTGHLYMQESKALVKEAAKAGVKKIVFTHTMGLESSKTQRPGMPPRNPEMKDLEELVSLGAYLEWDYGSTLAPTLRDPRLVADGVRKFGVERCLIVTDLGQAHNPSPVEGMRAFIKSLLMYGISEKEVGILAKDNPSRLLGLD